MKLDISKLGKVWKVLLLAVFWSCIVVGVYAFMFDQIAKKSEHISVLNGEVDSLTSQSSTIKLAKESISQTVDLRTQVDGYFIAKEGEVSFLNSIQALAGTMGLSPELTVDIKPLESTPDVFEELHLGVTVEGLWTDVVRFEALLELLPYKVVVNEVALTKNSETVQADPKKSVIAKSAWRGDFKISVLKFK